MAPRYKDESNLRAHYKKRHGQKLHGMNIPTLEDYLKTMAEEERVYHESILCRSEHYKRLVAYKRDGRYCNVGKRTAHGKKFM